MRNIAILCIILLSNIWGFSQNFRTSDNMIIEKITEIEFRNAYQSKRQSIYKWKTEKEYPKTMRYFLDSDIARRNYIFDNQGLSIRCVKLNSESYILQETKDVLSNAYYINGYTTDITAMFGVGDVDNEQIYYATPDYDQHLWCRWYTFTDGKVSILAEIEDKTFEYDLADYDLPPFFADNRGYYYIVVHKNPNIYNDVDEKTFYKISLK